MMKFKTRLAVVSGIAVAGVAFSATAAMASVVTVGGSSTLPPETVTGTNSGNITFLSDAGEPMTCTSSTISGTVTPGASVSAGSTIGSIDNLTFSSCDATSLHFSVTVTKNGTASWPIKATGAPNANGTVPIEIDGVSAAVSGTACNFTATTPASTPVTGIFTPGTSATAAGTITINTSNTPLLIAVGGSGITCGGTVYDGDHADMAGTFALSDTNGAISHT